MSTDRSRNFGTEHNLWLSPLGGDVRPWNALCGDNNGASRSHGMVGEALIFFARNISISVRSGGARKKL